MTPAAIFSLAPLWRTIDPILHAWETDTAPQMESYVPCSWSPKAADGLLASNESGWRYSCAEHD